MQKLEEWGYLDIAINIGILIVAVAVGTYALYLHNDLLPWIYLVYAASMCVWCRYYACTRCYYYGKRCNLLGGICAKFLFKQREMTEKDPDDAIVGVSWFILTVFPIPFLIYYTDWIWLGLYIVLMTAWHIQHKFTACNKCKNTACPISSTPPGEKNFEETGYR